METNKFKIKKIKYGKQERVVPERHSSDPTTGEPSSLNEQSEIDQSTSQYPRESQMLPSVTNSRASGITAGRVAALCSNVQAKPPLSLIQRPQEASASVLVPN